MTFLEYKIARDSFCMKLFSGQFFLWAGPDCMQNTRPEYWVLTGR